MNVSVMNATYEQEVLDLVNSERASRGIPPLKRVTALDYAARYHSADLGQDNYFSHDSYDRENGSLVFECGTWDRISSFYPSASGENIAGGYSSPKSVMNAWMNSEG
ncbi:MAG: CAP domain-containing protein, partial [Anaerolineaceae bacterium]